MDDFLKKDKIIVIDTDKKLVRINEEKIPEIIKKYEKKKEKNILLVNLFIIKVLSYAKLETVMKYLDNKLLQLGNKVKELFKYLSIYSFCLWADRNKDNKIGRLLYVIGGLLKEYGRSALRTEGVDVNSLLYFTENQVGAPLFPEENLKKSDMLLLKEYLFVTIVNFVTVFLIPYNAHECYNMIDNNYWDEYWGLILRLKDEKLTEEEKKEIPRHIPLSLDGKTYINLFLGDFLFFIYTHLCYIKDKQITTDFLGLDVLKSFAKYAVIASNYNIIYFFQRNLPYQRFNKLVPHKTSYELKDNFNSFGMFLVLFMLVQDREVPLIIKKDAYLATLTEQFKIVLKDGKNYGLPEKKEELLIYYADELKKMKMINVNDIRLKSVMFDTDMDKKWMVDYFRPVFTD